MISDIIMSFLVIDVGFECRYTENNWVVIQIKNSITEQNKGSVRCFLDNLVLRVLFRLNFPHSEFGHSN